MKLIRHCFCLIAILVLIAGPVAQARPADAENDRAPADPYAEVRGMTISCPRSGQIWGTDATVETMRELKALGINWVTIHPYARISGDGTVGSPRHDHMYANPHWLTRPIEEAHRLGLKIMIKPHLAYWGSPFSWRGDITFKTDAQWQRFFDTYTQWITHVAQLARHADGFVVGTELDQTSHRQAQWRAVIAQVRQQYKGPITYAANWDTFEKVPFWDAVDVIGIQAYFPLTAEPGVPDDVTLAAAWSQVMARLNRFAAAHRREIVFTELGYNDSDRAAREPWSHHQGGPNAELIQSRCLTAALDALSQPDRVTGAFLWKWFPGQPRHEDFLKSTPTMRRVIADAWRR